MVYSAANAAAGKARARKLAQARTELDTLTQTAGTRYHPTTQAVTAKADQVARRRKVSAYLTTTLSTTPAGTPVFTWTFDQAAIDADAAGDGWYALLTNLPPTPTPRRSCSATRINPPSSDATATSKRPLPSHRCSCDTTDASPALITVICLALL